MNKLITILLASLIISNTIAAVLPITTSTPVLATTTASILPISAPAPILTTISTPTSTPLTLTPSTCQVAKTTQADTFSCPCSGGSGSYTWQFSQLPLGWTANNNVLQAPQGSIKDSTLYGCKVQVTDKSTKQSVSKSLFFYTTAGRITSCVDYYYDFQSNLLVSTAGTFLASGIQTILNSITSLFTPALSTSAGVINTNINIIKNMFNSVSAIGGGCGLVTLRPYFLGTGGLYSSDSTNPYLNQLPTQAQVNSLLASCNSTTITTFLVNVVRSKVDCKSVATFLNSFLQQLSAKIIDINTQITSTTELILSIQGQITVLQTQLTAAQSSTSTITITTLTAQITSLQSTITQTQTTQSSLQTKLTQLNKNVTTYQNQISTLVVQLKQYQQYDLDYSNQIDAYNAQILAIQSQIQIIVSKQSSNAAYIISIQNQIDSINLQIISIQTQITQTNQQIATAKQTITQTQGQITQIQLTIQSLTANATANKITIQNIQIQISQLQQNLTIANTTLINSQFIYNDLNSNYNSFTDIVNSNLNGCYNTIYNDKTNLFDQDDSGCMRFNGKDNLCNYITKVFGKAASNLTSKNLIFTKNSDKYINSTSSTSTNTTTTTSSSTTVDVNIQQVITVTQITILSTQWVVSYGSSQTVTSSNSFSVPAPGTVVTGQVSMSGTITSIIGSICQVIDSTTNISYNLYFSAGTSIQSVNSPVPEVGNTIYWLGTLKPGGLPTQYNVNQCICF